MDGIESTMHLERIKIDGKNGKYERDPRDYKSEMNVSDAKMFTLNVKMFAIKTEEDGTQWRLLWNAVPPFGVNRETNESKPIENP